MKYETPKMNIKSFQRAAVLTDSATNTADAEKALSTKADGGITKVNFSDLKFSL